MTTATTSLADWLLQRIADDEAVARDCAEVFPSPWEIADRGWRVRIYASAVPVEDFSSDVEGEMTARNPVVMQVEPDRHIEDPKWLAERVAHIARHDPARVLADCAARRAIVELHEEARQRKDIYNRGHDAGELTTADDLRFRLDANVEWRALDDTLRYLAAPYASHSEFDEAWAVS